MKHTHTPKKTESSEFPVHKTGTRFSKLNLVHAVILFLFVFQTSRIQAQACAVTISKTPSLQVCAGTQVTLSASTSFVNLGTGADGNVSINSTYYMDNVRSAVVGTNNSGINKVRIGSTSGFAAGNEVLVITMIDGNTAGNLAGRYEFKTISSISADTLLFTQALTNGYTASSTIKHQVVKVPQYNNVIITNGGFVTCSAWNGTTGGVLCFRAQGAVSVNNGGIISADSKGYRGISHTTFYRLYNGAQGEGIYGQGYTGGSSNGSNGSWNNANGNGGGGGTGLQDAGGAGGGSYGTAGVNGAANGGHNGGTAGSVIGSSSLSLLYLGGAGGEGGSDEDGGSPGGGGHGGGIIFISANSLSVNGVITSAGANGGNGNNTGGGSGCGMAGGGGGAGGTIYLSLNSFSGTGTNVTAPAGAAGLNNGCGGNGGNGGTGRIRIDMPGTIPSTSPVAYAGTVPPLTGLTYSWSTGTSASSIVVSPTITTNYSVTITSTSGCTGSGAMATVTVNAAPALSISGPSTLCAGQSATLTANGASTYTWSNGSNASYIVVNPSSTTSYSLTGKSAAGCQGATSVNEVTVNANPVISVNSGVICSGESFTMTASGASSYLYAGGSMVVTPSSNSTYTVTGTGTNGCQGNVAISSITVNPLPVLSISGVSSICEGSSTTLTASGANTYVWSDNSTASGLAVTPSITTIYSLTGTSTEGCVNYSSASVTVNPLPMVTISGTNALCQGTSIILTASGATTYTWNNSVSNSFNVVSPAADTTYNVIGTSAQGCSNTAVVQVTVYTLPVVSISGANSMCAGNSVTLSASGADSFLWNTSSTSPVVAVSPATTTSYSLIGTNTNGCTGNTAIHTITVNSLPIISLTNSSALCAGNSVTLSAGGANTYVWNNASTGNSIVLTPTANVNYSVSGTDLNGCIGNSQVNTVTVNAIPVVSISGPLSLCTGDNSTLTATGANSYLWSNSNTNASINISPSTSAVYTVTGTSSEGCTNTAVANVSVNSVPVITISGIATICAGSSATLTANGSSTYSWSTGATGSVLVVSPSTNSNYSVIGTNPSGCSGNSPVTTVTVNTLPVTTISGTTAVCAGQSLSLTASGASTYSWNTGSTSANVVVTPTSNTTYTVSGTSAEGCTTNSIKSVTVNVLPLVIITGNASICSGVSASLSASGANTYSWNTGASSSQLVVTPSSNTSYSVTGYSAEGCQADAIVTITVNTLPVVTINGASTICAGNSTSLIANGASTYSWSNGSANTSIAVSPTASTSYSVIGTSAAGCTGNATQNVVVNVLPVISIGGQKTICSGDSTLLTANGAQSYTWNTGSNSAAIMVTPSATTVYTVTALSSLGCFGSSTDSVLVNALPLILVSGSPAICSGDSTTWTLSGANTYTWNTGSNATSLVLAPSATSNYTITATNMSGCYNQLVNTLTVNPNPLMNITGMNVICAGSSATLTAAGADTYTWSTGDNGNSTVVAPVSNTFYTVSGTNIYNCSSTTSTSVQVNASPVLTLNASASTLCSGETATLSISGADTYNWASGEITDMIVVTPNSTSQYTVTGTNALNCSSTSTLELFVSDCTGLNALSANASAIKLYPNPNNGEFVIELPENNDATITILNALGQHMVSTKAAVFNHLDLRTYNNGIYFVQIRENNQLIFKGTFIKN